MYVILDTQFIVSSHLNYQFYYFLTAIHSHLSRRVLQLQIVNLIKSNIFSLLFSGVIQNGNEFCFATEQIVRNIVDTKVLTVQPVISYRPEQILVNHLGEYLVQINGILYPILT